MKKRIFSVLLCILTASALSLGAFAARPEPLTAEAYTAQAAALLDDCAETFLSDAYQRRAERIHRLSDPTPTQTTEGFAELLAPFDELYSQLAALEAPAELAQLQEHAEKVESALRSLRASANKWARFPSAQNESLVNAQVERLVYRAIEANEAFAQIGVSLQLELLPVLAA